MEAWMDEMKTKLEATLEAKMKTWIDEMEIEVKSLVPRRGIVPNPKLSMTTAAATSLVLPSGTGDPQEHAQLSVIKTPRRLSLLGLPIEIRSKIYRELLVVPFLIVNLHNRPFNFGVYVGPLPNIHSYPVLYLCKQMRAEATEVMYKENTFHFTETPSFAWQDMRVPVASVSLSIDTANMAKDLPTDGVARQRTLDYQGRRMAESWFDTQTSRSMLYATFPRIKVLRLDFSRWSLKPTDTFPPELLTAVKGAARRLEKVVLVGMGQQLAVKQEIEGAVAGSTSG